MSFFEVPVQEFCFSTGTQVSQTAKGNVPEKLELVAPEIVVCSELSVDDIKRHSPAFAGIIVQQAEGIFTKSRGQFVKTRAVLNPPPRFER
ncbi:MAG: hypothetical protein IID18_04040 [Nitrospinae bacterium]|nr:hypothetical protein [Nitrospinota bacterium]